MAAKKERKLQAPGPKPSQPKSGRPKSKSTAAGRDAGSAASSAQPGPHGPGPAPPSDGRRFPVVGIGASAGGLAALKKLFAGMPAKSGMAFVVVPHLDPTHESLMAGLIGNSSQMPVVQASEGTAVKPDHVYVIPPNKYLAIQRGVLHLSGPVEEFETSSEELKAGNEELESSKQELQSLNEELESVNEQLQKKNEHLEALNNDITNLLNSTQIATLFLGPDCRIRRFTPACAQLFHLLPSDVGRPLTDLAHRFTDDDLGSDVDRVLRDLAPRERDVQTADGVWFIRRVMPYLTVDHRIDGVVVTFSDVTMLKQAEIALQQNQELKCLTTVLADSNDAIILKELDGRITAWNRGAERMYGYSEAEALGLNISELIPEQSRAEELPFFEALRRGEAVPSFETRRLSRDGRMLDVSLTATLLRNDAGEPTAISTTERDVTDKIKEIERAFREIAADEQRRIGQDLHDGTGQELTGLGLVAKTLADALRKDKSPELDLANKLVKGIQRVLAQIRSISRNLIPVEVDSEGLTAALTDLAARIDGLNGAACTFQQKQAVSLENHETATQLYRIAQEAVTNSIRHGQARQIIISLGQEQDRTVLRVQDDGVGFQDEKPAADGVGLSTMRYRAGLINAKLHIQAAPIGGTLVTCVVGAIGK